MLTDFLRKVWLGEDLGFGGVIGRKGVSGKAIRAQNIPEWDS